MKKLLSVVNFIAQSVISSMNLSFSYIYESYRYRQSHYESRLQQEIEELRKERRLFKEACRNVKNVDEFIELIDSEISNSKRRGYV